MYVLSWDLRNYLCIVSKRNWNLKPKISTHYTWSLTDWLTYFYVALFQYMISFIGWQCKFVSIPFTIWQISIERFFFFFVFFFDFCLVCVSLLNTLAYYLLMDGASLYFRFNFAIHKLVPLSNWDLLFGTCLL